MHHVYFGGSFDPPHIGHLEMLLSLLEDPNCDCLHLVPTSINPFKQEDDRPKYWWDKELRMGWMRALTEIAAAQRPLDKDKLKLENIEIEKNETCYTLDTLVELKKQFSPDDKWTLAMGSDLLAGLPRWKDIESLLSECYSLWVFRRGGDPNPVKLYPESLQSICPLRVMSQPILNISSTQIRTAFETNQTGFVEKSMPPACFRLLRDHKSS